MPNWDDFEPDSSGQSAVKWDDFEPLDVSAPSHSDFVEPPRAAYEPVFNGEPAASPEILAARNANAVMEMRKYFPDYGKAEKSPSLWQTVNTPILEATPTGGRFLNFESH